MPAQRPGKSETVVRTPPEFLTAVRSFLGITTFAVDLACCDDNAVAPLGITKEMDSLLVPWADLSGDGEWCWLNPPFDHIAPWAKKCSLESDPYGDHGAWIAMLVPASVGSNWWRDFVHQHAHVHFLNGRITFLFADGTPQNGPYPKDLALCLYGDEPGYDVWDWRRESSRQR